MIKYKTGGDNMILAVDVGNTNIVLGVLDGDDLVTSGRLSTNIYETD